MIKIIFESHSTSIDNEAGTASGWLDVELSEAGKKQAVDLGRRYQNVNFNAVFCSDLQRSYKTAELAFSGRGVKIIKDARLRECNYGQLSGHPLDELNRTKSHYIEEPFPFGESYEEAIKRVESSLMDLLNTYPNSIVMIIGHRATQYGLEHFINKTPILNILEQKWKWQPGWTYQL